MLKKFGGKTNKNPKLRILNSNVKAVLLYGSEMAKYTEDTKRIQTFINKSLCRILHLKWTDDIQHYTRENDQATNKK
ncbi:hypothetical protein NP493_2534g00001 [Ridgeia piscesae]|uniref:Uncharacterized protein n=1 Tax=Ridgeia piscesae TaxID=27915 RepID=A0AAD9JH30_RIDPI|nr:hypothetical protein NP493_2534g00001 [Ridgeia piscesae]